jgi:GGDEF domain-containing protein
VLEVLESLTYRKRYEHLLERSGRDGLTGVLNRGRFEADGPVLVRDAAAAGDR